jgi:hypothetical protein
VADDALNSRPEPPAPPPPNVVITGRSGSTGRRHAASALGLNAPRPLTPSRTSPARWSMTAISGRSAQQIHSLMIPLDLEAIAVWEEENGGPWDPDAEDHDNASLSAAPAPRTPRSPSTEHPRCRLCRKVRHHYAESADGLLRVCLDCAAGLPLAQLTGADAAAELIAQRRPVHRRDFVQRLQARFPALPWDAGIVREGRQRRHVRQTASDTIAGSIANTPSHA